MPHAHAMSNPLVNYSRDPPSPSLVCVPVSVTVEHFNWPACRHTAQNYAFYPPLCINFSHFHTPFYVTHYAIPHVSEAPLKLKSFLLLDVHWKRQICPYSPCIADSVNYLNFQSNTDSGGHWQWGRFGSAIPKGRHSWVPRFRGPPRGWQKACF